MRLLLLTAGSRGDVEPFAALAAAAAAAGHRVRLAAPEHSGADVDDVDTVGLGADFSAVIADQGVSVLAAARSYRTTVRPLMRRVITGAVDAALAFEPDIIAAHPKVLSAPLIAQALSIPHVLVELTPSVTPTRDFPAAGTVATSLGPLNRLTYRAATAASAMFREPLDEAARMLGMRAGRPTPPPAATLVPISPALLPRPQDWPERVHLTGPWTRPRPSTALDPVVAAFVAEGPFVYAGFGSMARGDAARRGRALIEATRGRGRRLLAATGMGGLEIAPELRGSDVLVVRSVPHHAVLPGADVAIHHGGIGTVQAATLAAAVSVVMPFSADQPFWGAMLHRAALAPAPVSSRRTSVARLAEALDEAPRYQQRIDAVANRMRAEDAAAEATAILAAIA